MEKSPNYPFLGLEEALGRAKTIFKAAHSHPMSVEVAADSWGYSPSSGSVGRIVGTLRAYGLTDTHRDSTERKIKLTDQALRYFRDEREVIRQGLLREFALRPKILHRLWKQSGWGSNPPSDEVARSHLKVDLGYNEKAARSVLDIYKKNIAFAGLVEADGSADEESETAPAPESNGGSGARERGSGAFQPAAAVSSAVSAGVGDDAPPGDGMRKAMFPVEEGDVTLVFPDKMSRESFEDLRGYLDIFLKRQERAALAGGGSAAAPAAAADALFGDGEEGVSSAEKQDGEEMDDDVPL